MMRDTGKSGHGCHEHGDGHAAHGPHDHASGHGHPAHGEPRGTVLTIRSHSGLSGDMLLAGLTLMNVVAGCARPGAPASRADACEADTADASGTAGLCAAGQRILTEALAPLAAALPELAGCATLTRRDVGGVGGWHVAVSLPHAHAHRGLADVEAIIDASALDARAAALARQCFGLLARCEAEVHGKRVEDVHFHEVGALDSILDICGVCALYCRLAPGRLVVGPLPLADGFVDCAHGRLPAPAPAVLALLADIPVRPFAGSAEAGELVTPTAIALVRTLGAEFGPWPDCRIRGTALVYGTRTFAHAANGVIFALGDAPA